MSPTRTLSPIYLEHEGKPVRASELVWLHVAPCGCLSGVSTADRGDGDVLTSVEQVRAESLDGIKVLIERDREDGFTYRLATWDEYRALRMDCDHDPKWGVRTVALPEGHVWATTDRWHRGRRTHKRHIVAKPDGHDRSTALCGKAPGRDSMWWTEDRSDLHDTVTCRRCETAVTR